jgi:hypothetical protein
MKSSYQRTTLLAISGAFITYCSMYAFRKPFSAGTYEGLFLGGIDYKIVLILTQVIGYTLSKFLGIKVVSEMPAKKRIGYLLGLIGIAYLSLLGFALTPAPYNAVFLFFNGLPLGMIWGIVFAFLEGRKNTELLGAAMASSFVIASGLVKSVGRFTIEHLNTSEFWMPFLTGTIFIPPLFLGAYWLSLIPPPNEEDVRLRSERVPMEKNQRKAFFSEFKWGIVISVVIYVSLTIFRDIRDNFAVEIWTLLDYQNIPQALTLSEIPIAIGVFILISAMIYIKDNRNAFYLNIAVIALSGALLVATTIAFSAEAISPLIWMIGVGFFMYLAYISFHTMLFERWIALFKFKSNIGYLMYVCDAMGYLGSAGILFYKNFGFQSLNWLNFLLSLSYIVGFVTFTLGIFAIFYFKNLERKRTSGLNPY